jgi:hypothetical protein
MFSSHDYLVIGSGKLEFQLVMADIIDMDMEFDFWISYFCFMNYEMTCTSSLWKDNGVTFIDKELIPFAVWVQIRISSLPVPNTDSLTR